MKKPNTIYLPNGIPQRLAWEYINAYPNHGNCCVSSAIDRVCIGLCIILKNGFVWDKNTF